MTEHPEAYTRATFDAMAATGAVSAVESEAIVLSGMIEEPEALALLITSQTPDAYFNNPLYKQIYRILNDMYLRGDPIDRVSLQIELGAKDLLTSYLVDPYLCDAEVQFFETRRWNAHLQQLTDGYYLYQFYKLLNTAGSSVFVDPGKSLRERRVAMEEQIGKMSELTVRFQANVVTSELWRSYLLEVLDDAMNGVIMQYQASGIKQLDDLTGGWPRARVSIVAARTSHGKTLFLTKAAALQMRQWILAGENKQVIYYSPEINESDMRLRFASQLTGLPISTLRNSALMRRLDDTTLAKARKELEIAKQMNFVLSTEARPTMQHVRSLVRSARAKRKVGMIIIDYLELIRYTGRNPSKDLQLEEAIFESHEMAKEEDMPVLIAAQLSRAIEKRGKDAKPNLSDIRYAGSAEQLAGMVVALFHPARFWKQIGRSLQASDAPNPFDYTAHVIKNTNGPIGDLAYRWMPNIPDIVDAIPDRVSLAPALDAPF